MLHAGNYFYLFVFTLISVVWNFLKEGNMINSVNPLMGVQNVQAGQYQMQQPAAQPINQQVQNPNLNGVNALASYNQPAKTAPKTITPALPTVLQPEAIRVIEGERVTAPNGTLDSIIKRNDKTTTIYKMDVLAPNDAIRKIEVYDNTTGKLISEQENFNDIKPGKMPSSFLTEINERNSEGKITKTTVYSHGKLDNVAEIEYGPNGYEKATIIYADGTFAIEESTETTIQGNTMSSITSKRTQFDAKGQIVSVETIDRENRKSEKVTYKNGIPSSIKHSSEEPIANNTGINPFADKDLVPAQPYILGYDPKSVEGEKKYFSNGVLHSIVTNTGNGDVIHMFDVTGRLTGIEDAKDKNNVKSIIFNNNPDVKYQGYSIVEQLGEKVTKTTMYNNDGEKEVYINNLANNTSKSAVYKDDKLVFYTESNSDDDRIAMSFDKQGNLVKVL